MSIYISRQSTFPVKTFSVHNLNKYINFLNLSNGWFRLKMVAEKVKLVPESANKTDTKFFVLEVKIMEYFNFLAWFKLKALAEKNSRKTYQLRKIHFPLAFFVKAMKGPSF